MLLIVEQVLTVDIGESALEHLSIASSQIFLPLLSNPGNQVGWPPLVVNEVMESMHSFSANGKPQLALLISILTLNSIVLMVLK